VHFPRHFRPFCLSHSLYPSLIALILVLRLPRFWSLDDLSLDIMGSPALPATSTTSGLPKIPTDLLLVIREHLVLNHQIGTAAKLMTCSKAFFELFEPVVDYTFLTVSSRNKDKLFWGLTGRKCSALPPVNAEYQHKCQASLKARQVETFRKAVSALSSAFFEPPGSTELYLHCRSDAGPSRYRSRQL
jgi:hypothetical protein